MASDISAMLWGSWTNKLWYFCFRGFRGSGLIGLPYPKGGYDLNLYLGPDCASRDDSADALFLGGGGWEGCRDSKSQQIVRVRYMVPLPLKYKEDKGDTIATCSLWFRILAPTIGAGSKAK